MGTDELKRQIRLDELNDATKLSVREYAERRSLQTGTIVQPQLLYYYVRTGKLHTETCICGRKVLDVATTDKFFEERDKRA
jgi:hypothetical protein